MSPLEAYVVGVILSFCFHQFAMRVTDRWIAPHSDGGGWDAGTAYSYVPGVALKDCMLMDEMSYPGYASNNLRVRCLVFALDLIPGWIIFHLAMFVCINVPAYLCAFFSQHPHPFAPTPEKKQ
jgi:hypothetical protein